MSIPRPLRGIFSTLKQLYPPIHLREIERILARKFGYQTNHHTLQRFLASIMPSRCNSSSTCRLFDFADAYQARWTVVRMAL